MPFEDGIRNATKNLDKAAEAAPTSQVEHATDEEEKTEGTEERAHDRERVHNGEDAPDVKDPNDDSED